MQRRNLESELRRHLDENDCDVAHSNPKSALDLVAGFYRIARFENCDLDNDGDMLLFQWGVNDLGDGEFFDVDFTRQLIDGSNDENLITQVSYRFRYRATDQFRSIESGNVWCEHIDLINRFSDDVRASRTFQLANRMTQSKIDIRTTMSR
ncbi:hypothetical protein MFFC18_21460 [Mariniblastus fucicola]|uniref:Uncharacterized protein n=1 Tax=Mariniblastus fucicola TaxID=980251 RepID=A0A5B9PBA1_9BACT|nr:hypothetical protein MFFC18_21460 [Mariniblastus fucicola]